MQKIELVKVLLCAPSNIINCGISRWTNHILNHYGKVESSIILQHYYPKLEGVYSDTPLLKRIWLGLKYYSPFLLSLKQKLNHEKYNVLHFTSSGSLALIRDIITIIIAKKYNVKTIVHFCFGRIPDIYKKKLGILFIK